MTHRIERIGNAELHLARCEDVIGDVRADLVLTDPPYGISLKTYNPSRVVRPYTKKGDIQRVASAIDHRFTRIVGDESAFDPECLLGFANLVLWGANHYAHLLPPSPCWFSWDKKCERAADSTIGDCELAWVRGLPFVTVRAFRHMWAGFQRDSQVGDKRLHPAEKPVALMSWCLSFFPNARTVFDPYAGSGPVAVACIRAGRNYIGVECDPFHYETALRRIEQAYRQPDLFVALPSSLAQPLPDLFPNAPTPEKTPRSQAAESPEAEVR
jgi:site-specific DNA-methyltransferase (adenine-specific)